MDAFTYDEISLWVFQAKTGLNQEPADFAKKGYSSGEAEGSATKRI